MIVGKAIIERLAAPSYAGLCIVLGGASAAGFAVNALLQIIGVVFLVTLLWRPGRCRTASRGPFVLLVTIAALLAISLFPLPSVLWTALPGRAAVAAGYRLVGAPLPALPLSLSPDATIRALLSLTPPAAMITVAAASSPEGRRNAVVMVCALAMASVMLGLLQQFTGFNSRFYVYAVTSRGGAPGFFANRNHQATLSLMAMPLLAGLAREVIDDVRVRNTKLGLLSLFLGAFMFLAIAVVIMQSIAGWLLLLPAVAASALVYFAPVRAVIARWLVGGIVAVLLAGLVLVMFTGQLRSTVDTDELQPRQRAESISLTLKAARDYFPVGSGLGSFQNVYPGYEPPEHATHTFVNHAHNDYAEVALEAGLAGIVLVLAFLAWWGRQSYFLWSAPSGSDAIARAATASIAIVIAHSLVDYPARTSAIAATAALCCALMAERRNIPDRARTAGERLRRNLGLSQSRMIIAERA